MADPDILLIITTGNVDCRTDCSDWAFELSLLGHVCEYSYRRYVAVRYANHPAERLTTMIESVSFPPGACGHRESQSLGIRDRLPLLVKKSRKLWLNTR